MRFLVFILFVTSAFGADKWIHANSAHFDMYSAGNEADTRAALQHLEAVRGYFLSATHSQDPGGQPVRIIDFQSAGEYEKYRPAEYAGSDAFSQAGAPATIVAVGLKPQMYEKIFQEYCELVMDESAPKVPFWLRAGLAQFYSTLKPGENTMKLGGPPYRSYHIHGDGQVDLNQLVSINKAAYLASRTKGMEDFGADTDHTTSHGNAALGNGKATNALNEAAGSVTQDYETPDWTLTHMLMFSPDYRAKVGEFIGVLSSGQETGTAFTNVYGRSMAQVVIDLQLYMKQSALAVATVKYNYEKPAAPQVKAAAKEDVDRILAELSKAAK